MTYDEALARRIQAERAFFALPAPSGMAVMTPDGYSPEYRRANAEVARAIYDEAHADRA